MSAKKFNETAEFKKLQKEWAKKLADSGFEDIEKGEMEYVVNRQEFTIPTETRKYKKTSEHQMIGAEVNVSAKEESEEFLHYSDYVSELGGLDHYEYCQTIIREFDFKRPVDKVVFELYAEGIAVRDISEEITRRGFKTIKKTAINDLIARIKEQFQRG